MKRKKGQSSGSQAGLLVLIITGLIIAYILFLPSADRAELLGENSSADEDNSSSSSSGNGTIFREGIGRVDYFDDDNFEKLIPNIFLKENIDAEVLAEFNPFVIKNGWFEKQKAELEFNIDDIENTDNIKLSFSSEVFSGTLSIDVNGKRVYDSQLQGQNIDPIKLDKTLLNQRNNLTFSVSSVGGKFWKTNEYHIKEAKIIGDIEDTSGKTSSSVFNLAGFEFYNLEDAEIVFAPYCNQREVGVLKVFVNNINIYSGVPLCNNRMTFKIPLAHFNAGQNSVMFRTEKGSYSVEEIKISGDLKEVGGIVRYFELDKDQYNDVINDDLIPRLYIYFVNDNERKQATLNINGHLYEIDQRESDYNFSIKNYVQQFNNYVKIEPKSKLDIVSLEVKLDEK